MGVLANIIPPKFEAQSTSRDPRNNFWFTELALPTLSGVNINADTALTLSVVWACVRILSSSIASLPCIMYRRLPNDGKERDRSHPLYDILRWQPNTWMTAYEFWEMMIGHAALRGRGLAQIVPGVRGSVDQLIPIHPDRVLEVQRLEDGTLRYKIAMPTGGPVFLMQDEVFDLRMFTVDGINPCSIIKLARGSLGLTKATEDYGAAFFGNSSVPKGALVSDKPVDLETRKELREQWNEKHQGSENAHKVAVMQNGLKWQQIGLTAEDSQYLQTRQFQLDEVSRWFGVQPHLVANLLRSTNNNIEAQGQEFLTFTLRPWLIRTEQAIRRDLIVAKRLFFAEFLVNALLRGDFKTRTEGYNKLIMTGVMTRNEARQLENMNPLPGLDDPLIPLNMTTVDSEGNVATQEPAGNEFGAKALDVSARDASKKIAAAEIRDLEKRADKAAADSDRFDAWVKGYCDGHGEYVGTVLWSLRLSDSVNEQVVSTLWLELTSGEAVEALESMRLNRATQIYEIIKGELFA
jgi:HK97 family phage portal protein